MTSTRAGATARMGSTFAAASGVAIRIRCFGSLTSLKLPLISISTELTRRLLRYACQGIQPGSDRPIRSDHAPSWRPARVALEHGVNEPPVGLDDRVDIRHEGIAPGDVEADLLSDETVVLAEPPMPGELDDGAVETEILISDGDSVARTARLNESVQRRHDHLLALLGEGADREPCAQLFERR